MATKIDTGLPRSNVSGGGMACSMTLATVNRVARMRGADETGLAKLHRISNEGAELSSIMHLHVGQLVRLDLSETVSTTASVISRSGKRYDLQFEQPVNCAELLRRLVDEARTGRARPLRLAINTVRARVRGQHGVHQLEVEDISQRGMKMRHEGKLQVNSCVCIQLPNGQREPWPPASALARACAPTGWTATCCIGPARTRSRRPSRASNSYVSRGRSYLGRQELRRARPRGHLEGWRGRRHRL